MMDFSLIQTGLPITALAVQSPHIQALVQSGYRGDGLDFAGYIASIGGAMTGKLGIARAGVSGFDHALDISFDHVGGAAGGPLSQLGHGINLAVTFTPGATTTRGMQSQKITATMKGAGSGGGGIDNAAIAAMDLSTVVDATRTGRTSLAIGINSVSSKFNAVDDTPANGLLTAGLFVANLHAGVTNVVGLQVNANADGLVNGVQGTASAPEFYGVQVLPPVFGPGCSVTTRMAAVEVGDWSAAAVVAQGGTTPNGYAFHALGGDIYLANGDFEAGSNTKGPVIKSANGSRYRVAVSNAGALSTTGPL